ncbi:MAG: hypothetical protein Q8R31_06650, partial [Candidatus Omnitrophota bacterium]|nr:hypothetical protein [Candidatus Omnitrophota bacterium]
MKNNILILTTIILSAGIAFSEENVEQNISQGVAYEDELDTIVSQLTQVQNEKQGLQAKLEQLSSASLAKDKTLADLSQAKQELLTQLKDTEGQLKGIEQEKNNLENQNQLFSQQAKDLESKLSQIEAQRNKLQNDNQLLTQ